MDIKVKSKPVKLASDLEVGEWFSFNNDSNTIVDDEEFEDKTIFRIVKFHDTKFACSTRTDKIWSLDSDLDEEVTTYKQKSPLELEEE